MPAPPWRVSRAHVWFGYLGIGLAAVLVYYLLPARGLLLTARLVIYLGLSTSAAVSVFLGLRWYRVAERRPWLLIGVSQVVYAGADATFYVSHYLLGVTAYPALSDVLYLSHYPLLVIGLGLLAHQRSPRRDRAGLLDGSMLFLAAVLLSWLYLIAPRMRVDQSLLVGITSVGYPAMDLALLGVAINLMVGHGRRPAAFFLLAANLLGILTADTLYVVQQTSGSFEVGNYLDAIWLVGNLALGAAALHPTMADLTAPASPTRPATHGGLRLIALGAAGLVAPTVLAVQAVRGDMRGLVGIAAASASMMILIIVRMAGLITEQRRLAITDGLTGLRTRRFLEAEMRVAAERVRRAGSAMGLILVDVDHFKSVNDRFGHPAGDQVLTEVARRLRLVTRPGDVVARYGGEEFALLALNVDGPSLVDIAERLRRGVGREPVRVATLPPREVAPSAPTPAGPAPDDMTRSEGTPSVSAWTPANRRGEASGRGGTRGREGADARNGRAEDSFLIRVTVSVGAATFPDHADGPFGLVAAADRALYAAKSAGRNRVAVGTATGTATATAAVSAPAPAGPAGPGPAGDPAGLVAPVGSVLVGSAPMVSAPLGPAPIGSVLIGPASIPPFPIRPASTGPRVVTAVPAQVAVTAATAAVTAVLAATVPRDLPGYAIDGIDCLRRLADDVDARQEPRSNTRLVAHWVSEVLAALGQGAVMRHHARLAARLHKVGKIVLPPHVLARPGPLDPEEWALLRLYPRLGANLVALVPGLEGEAEIIAQHREWYGGGGYPAGIAGSQIRLEARVIAVCGAWDAIRTGRGNRPGQSSAAAREQLLGGRATQFDPTVVDVFLTLEAERRVGRLPHRDDPVTVAPAPAPAPSRAPSPAPAPRSSTVGLVRPCAGRPTIAISEGE